MPSPNASPYFGGAFLFIFQPIRNLIQMKITLFYPVLFSVLSLLFACKHTQYTADHLPDELLRWGNGGGITGKETSYVLLENGQLFQRDGAQAALTALPSIKSRKADGLVDKAEKLGVLTLAFAHPGNTYQFIEFEDEGKKNRVVWGDGKFPVSADIAAFYQELTQLTATKQ